MFIHFRWLLCNCVTDHTDTICFIIILLFLYTFLCVYVCVLLLFSCDKTGSASGTKLITLGCVGGGKNLSQFNYMAVIISAKQNVHVYL